MFDLKPEPVQVEEGETAKFMAKVGGHPRPRLTWWVNGSMIIAVSLHLNFLSLILFSLNRSVIDNLIVSEKGLLSV